MININKYNKLHKNVTNNIAGEPKFTPKRVQKIPRNHDKK